MQGGEVDLFGVDERVFCAGAEVVDIFGEIEVGGWLAG